MFGLWLACATAAVACLSYGVVWWLIRQRRKCFEAFDGTGVPTVPLRSLINGNSDEYWKPDVVLMKWHSPERKFETTIESIGRWLKEYGDVFGFFIGDTPFMVVKDLDMIDEIFVKDLKNFTERGHITRLHELQPSLAGNILFTKGNEWKEIRNTMAQFFTPTKLKSVSLEEDTKEVLRVLERRFNGDQRCPVMPSLLDAQKQFLKVLGEHADSGSEVDIKAISERLTFDVVCKVAFGIDTDVQRNPQQPLFQVALATVPNFMTGFFYNLAQNLFHWSWLVRAFSYVINIIYSNPMLAVANKALDVIEFRRQNPQVNLPDMAQILLDNALAKRNDVAKKMRTAKSFSKGTTTTSEERAPLPKKTMAEMAGNCMVIFLGGYDTTRLVFTYWFFVMGRHQDVQEKMRQEALDAFEKEGDHLSMQTLMSLEYANQVINETLRMFPPIATLITRAAEEDFQCGKYLIRKGTSIISSPYHFHHDPQYWNDPEKFDPERFSPENKKLIHPIVFQPFGLGRRMCIGYRLALVEILSVTTEVLRYFRITLGSSQKLELELDTYAGLAVPKEEVWIRMQRLSDVK